MALKFFDFEALGSGVTVYIGKDRRTYNMRYTYDERQLYRYIKRLMDNGYTYIGRDVCKDLRDAILDARLHVDSSIGFPEDWFATHKNAAEGVYCRCSPLSLAESKGEKMEKGYFKIDISDETTVVIWQSKEGPRSGCFCVGTKVKDKYENDCFSNVILRLINMGYVHETGVSDLVAKLLVANIGNEVLRKTLNTDIILPKVPTLKWRHPGQIPEIKKVIFNPPATIVMWEDGTKTVVKCREGEEYSKEAGLAFCVMKKTYGRKFHRMFKDWCNG